MTEDKFSPMVWALPAMGLFCIGLVVGGHIEANRFHRQEVAVRVSVDRSGCVAFQQGDDADGEGDSLPSEPNSLPSEPKWSAVWVGEYGRVVKTATGFGSRSVCLATARQANTMRPDNVDHVDCAPELGP